MCHMEIQNLGNAFLLSEDNMKQGNRQMARLAFETPNRIVFLSIIIIIIAVIFHSVIIFAAGIGVIVFGSKRLDKIQDNNAKGK